jgi:hypothetical protein
MGKSFGGGIVRVAAAAVAAGSLAIGGPAMAAMASTSAAAYTSDMPGQLDPGGMLDVGQSLVSPDGQYVLTMQGDGNLVEYAPGHVAVAASNTAGDDGAVLFMQNDGNLVVRAPGNIPVWASGTDQNAGTVLQVQDDGSMVLYAPGHVALRVLVPVLVDLSVPTPHVGAPLPYEGGSDSEASNYVYDGTRLVSCASVGKAVEHFLPRAYGVGIDIACGITTDTGDQPRDGYYYLTIIGCALTGPLGPACDILTDPAPGG